VISNPGHAPWWGVWVVGWEPHSERKHVLVLHTVGKEPLKRFFPGGVKCFVVSSYRPISTGQLHESLVLASTSGLSTQWSGWGPLTR
jgi:hypothetical protein